MRSCPTCEGPMVWSDDHRRVWCAVWGDHLAPLEKTPARFVNVAARADATDTERRLRVVS